MRSLAFIVILIFFAAMTHGSEPAPGTVIIHPIDGAEMVWVPGGPFVMGLDRDDADRIARDLGYGGADDLWAWDSYPKRVETVDGFFIDRREVTVERWRKFAAADETADRHPDNMTDAPAAQQRAAGTITWAAAQRYANWCGKSLPTNAQWEKAARGDDGRLYPWGDEAPDDTRLLLALPRGVKPVSQTVGRYPAGASPYGVLDMVGNQYEWVSDWLEPYPNNPEASRMLEYSGHRNGTLRGGSAYHGRISFFAAKRMGMPPEETHFHLGFRTVWRPPAGYFESPAFERDRRAALGQSKEPQLLRWLVSHCSRVWIMRRYTSASASLKQQNTTR